MEIFSNWVFWIILATIVFVLALIGYLTESMKKSKKEENKEKQPEVENNMDVVQPESTVTEVKAQADDWTSMPEVNKPLEEVKVDSISEPIENNESTNAVDDLFGTPSVAPVAPTVNTEANETVTDTVSADVTPGIQETVAPESVVESATEVSTPEVQPVETVNTTVTPEVQPVATDTQTTEPSTENNKNNDIWNL